MNVWTMPESKVYHLRADCPALHRRSRYWSPKREPVEDARRRYPGQRRVCRLCEKGA